ncbi:general substrate transporter [Gigaspora rosea]|uniref:General substrate transporter n=1 Tax=Gigaspora rosea TaxID=44941 RepID=A0A397UZ53_9GLOM|nr:general substrate transporter [Gigaspora rosea]
MEDDKFDETAKDSPTRYDSSDLKLRDFESDNGIASFVFFTAFTVAICGFMFGYDTGIISSAMLLLEQDFPMTSVTKGLVVGATTFGAIFSSICAGALSDLAGRRITTTVAATLFICGALVLSLASSYTTLLIGRLIVGIAVGLASMVVPIYISEISPRFQRGQLVTINVLMCTGGQLISYLVATGFIFQHGWRWMFGVSVIPPFLQLLFMPFIPESPRFLVRKGRTGDAKKILAKIYPGAPPEFLNYEIDIISQTIAEDAAGSYKQLFFYPNLRPLIIACGLQLFQQISGFDTAMYYGATIMKMAGFTNIRDAIVFSILVSATNFAMTVVALYLIDRVGRRRILLTTLIGTVIGLTLLGIGFVFVTGLTPNQNTCVDYGTRCGACLIDDRCGFSKLNGVCADISSIPLDQLYNACPSASLKGNWFTLSSLVVFVAAYALGIGHAPWTIQSEIFPLNVRGRANGIATATNWCANLVVAVTFLPLTELITASGTFWMYSIFMILGWLFVYFMVPETAGKSLEEIQELFL